MFKRCFQCVGYYPSIILLFTSFTTSCINLCCLHTMKSIDNSWWWLAHRICRMNVVYNGVVGKWRKWSRDFSPFCGGCLFLWMKFWSKFHCGDLVVRVLIYGLCSLWWFHNSYENGQNQFVFLTHNDLVFDLKSGRFW